MLVDQQLHPEAGNAITRSFVSAAVLQRGQDVLTFELRIVLKHVVDRSPGGELAGTALTVMRVLRMQGSPRMRAGSLLIRSKAMPRAYAARPAVGATIHTF